MTGGDDPRMVALAAKLVDALAGERDFKIQVEALCTVAGVMLATLPASSRASATERFAAAVARIVARVTTQDRHG